MSYIKYSKEEWEKEYNHGYDEYLQKEDMRYLAIAEYINLNKGKKVLDLGCGTGILATYLKNDNEYFGVDISDKAILKAKLYGKGEYECCNLNQYKPKYLFDEIIFNETLYYLDKPIETIDYFNNFLNSCGEFIVSIYQPAENHRYYTIFSSLVRNLQEHYGYSQEKVIQNNEGLKWRIFVIKKF